MHCASCGRDGLVAFSCKGRGFCPSCCGRRMAETAMHLADEVLPEVPIRQWVLSFPYRIRYLLAFDAQLCSAVRRIFVRTLLGWLRERGESVGISAGRSGAVVVAQRFGSALNVNLHFHALVLDGVYSSASPLTRPAFRPAAPLTDQDVVELTTRLHRRILRYLTRRGRLPKAALDEAEPQPDEPLLAELCAASVQGRVAITEQSGASVERLGRRRDARPLSLPGELCCDLEGFSLHAKVEIAGGRAPVNIQSLTFDASGRLFGGGTHLLEIDPSSGLALSSVDFDPGHVIDFHGLEFIPSIGVNIDFETEDDFTTALVNGQDLSSPPEFGRLFLLDGFGANLGAAIFDSSPGGPNDPSQDKDLLVGLGNVLMLQNSLAPAQSVPGIFDRPNDDQNGGTLAFAFVEPVEPLSLVLIDIDSGPTQSTQVTLFDSVGRLRVYMVPGGWTGDLLVDGPPGFGCLALDTLAPQPGLWGTATASEEPGFVGTRVVRMELRFGSSGGLDNLRFRPTKKSVRRGGRGISQPQVVGG